MNRGWISDRGLKPAKTSNIERATAISGLWLGSVNWSGSCLCSLVARFLLGCSWRGSAFAIDRICIDEQG